MTSPEQPVFQSEARGWSRFRMMTRWYTLASLVTAALVLILLNALGQRIPWRRDVSREGRSRLTQNTRLMLDGLQRDVSITAVLQPHHELTIPIRDLLREYDYASPRIQVSFLDPHRDLLGIQALAEEHGIRESNVMIVESAERQRVVAVESTAEFDYLPVLYGQNRKLRAFHGESAISAAIHHVSDMTAPVVYAIRGYSERDLNDPHPVSGYSALARLIRDEQMDLRELRIAEAGGIPDDADLLIMVGPRRRLAAAEVEYLARYLKNRGRLLLLLDPAETGLEPLLEEWGVSVGPGRVQGLSITGAEMFVGQYGEHPVTRNLAGITSVFYRPRPLYPNDRASVNTEAADRLRVSVLAVGRGVLGPDGETITPSDPSRIPAVAVAIEKGSAHGVGSRLRPKRIIVFGDADFVSNSGMVAGNNTLVVNALNWLVERDARLDIDPWLPGADVLLLQRRHYRTLFILIVIAVPAIFLALGIFTRWSRGASE